MEFHTHMLIATTSCPPSPTGRHDVNETHDAGDIATCSQCGASWELRGDNVAEMLGIRGLALGTDGSSDAQRFHPPMKLYPLGPNGQRREWLAAYYTLVPGYGEPVMHITGTYPSDVRQSAGEYLSQNGIPLWAGVTHQEWDLRKRLEKIGWSFIPVPGRLIFICEGMVDGVIPSPAE